MANDVRRAVRALFKAPGFTLIAVVTLALGIGANTAIFAVVNGVLLRPLPYHDASRVVLLWSHWQNWKKTWVSQSELDDYATQMRSLEHVAAFTTTSFNLTGGADTLRVRAAQAQSDIFPALGVSPLAGRFFTKDEDQPGHEHVALLGEGLWRSRFGSAPGAIGSSIRLDGVSYEVVGVIPSDVRLPIEFGTRETAEIWVPLALGSADPRERGNHGLFAVARLRDGVTLPRAQAEMDTLTRGFLQSYPNQYDAEFGVTLVTAAEEIFGGVRPALLVLVLAVGAVLLIACVNVVNLVLARTDARRKELAICAALGAGRARLIRHLQAESLVLSAAGGACGLGLAVLLVRTLVVLDPLKIPRVDQIGVDVRLLAYSAAVSTFAAMLSGLIPALQVTRGDLRPALAQGGRESKGSSGRLRHVLVVAEVAGSVALVAAALLLARSFARLMAVDAGFDASQVLTLRTSLPPASYGNANVTVMAYTEIGRRLRELPGVTAAGGVTGLPLKTTRGDWGVRIEGDESVQRIGRAADWQVVTPGYFEALRVPLRAGRTFSGADRADTLPVVIVNESMARRFWPGQNPIGRRLAMGGKGAWLTVVGIVGDIRHRGLNEPARIEMYRPHAQFRFGDADAPAVSDLSWAIRTTRNPTTTIADARMAIAAVDRDLGVSEVATMVDVVRDATSDRRLDMWLFAFLGGLALSLAAIGVYGVVSYSVTERTHEIGVRMAIGAQRADVMRMVLWQGARLGGIGVAAGLLIALGGVSLIRSMLFDLSPWDPATFAMVVGTLLAIVLLATAVPAWRATRVDPLFALRGD